MLELEQSALWEAFGRKASDGQREMVRKLASRAADRLDLVRDTFPTYTLHNRTHAFNVVRRIGDLLGPDVERITALEGAVLILGAFCHDVGMVFTEQERREIRHEQHFGLFLQKHPEAQIQIAKRDEIPQDIAEWYCRWIHPDRVFGFLKGAPKEEKTWGTIPIHEKLGVVCRSHGYDVGELIDDTRFPIEFLGTADLRFCAILLRLGDILDFDNTRTPDEVYRYLGIGKRETPRAEESDVEWRKHLVAGGFVFPADRAAGRYELRFSANPDHPGVEYDVRQFLDVIEQELQRCERVLRFCSPRWRNFRLPSGINRDDIVSSGYRYGEYRFTLEQNRVLDLLMGESLYDDPYVFIRELLQNAIDTTRHRAYFEQGRGNVGYAPSPITVSTWVDRDNYQWVRIDDEGMGMDEDIIVRYFLKIGESYYNSAQFRAEMLDHAASGRPRFVPISRFGIGVLSCFILGDRVEVSTRHAAAHDGQSSAIRLGLSGLHSFYVLQSERDAHYDAAEMPGRTAGERASYRKPGKFGTSVAVRLDPQKETTSLNLKALLDRYVLFSPVPVEFEGEEVGGDLEAVIEQPWADEVVEEELTAEEMRTIESVLGLEFTAPIKLRLVPLDLTKHSPTSNLKGQALVGYLVLDEEDERAVERLFDRVQHAAFLPNSVASANLNAEMKWTDHASQPMVAVQYHDPGRISVVEARMQELGRKHQELYEKLERGSGSRAAERALKRIVAELSSLDVERRTREAKLDLGRVLDRLSPRISRHPAYTLHNAGRWLAHNGISVPTRLSGAHEQFLLRKQELRFSGNSDYGSFWSRQAISLTDALRPDVSLSRDQLRNVPWEIYSAVTLAYRKAIAAHPGISLPIDSSSVFQQVIGREHFLLGRILADPLIGIDGAWARQDIIQTAAGMQSLEAIRTDLARGVPAVIVNLPSVSAFFHTHYGFNIVNVCAAALVQTGLRVRLEWDEEDNRRVIVDSPGEPLVRRGQELFPPLFFIPYSGRKLLRCSDLPLNQEHWFSEWLIDHAESLQGKYPGIFRSLRSMISVSLFQLEKEWKAHLNELNALLGRLWELDERLRPEKHIRLEPGDFELGL